MSLTLPPMSNDIQQLQHLLDLSLIYCKKHQVQLSAEKTKLVLYNKTETDYTKYARLLSPLYIDDTAEHVGVLRSVSGNLPHILQRILCHKRALGQILEPTQLQLCELRISLHHPFYSQA